MNPVAFEPTMQKSAGDCGVACLAMLLSKSYAEVRAAVPKRTQRDLDGVGLSTRQMLNLAKRLGCPLAYVPKPTPPLVFGILDMQRPTLDNPNKWEGHYALVADRVIYNPADGMLWFDAEAFFAGRRWEVVGVFTRTGDE